MGSFRISVLKCTIMVRNLTVDDAENDFDGNLLTLDYQCSSTRLKRAPSSHSRKSNKSIVPLDERMRQSNSRLGAHPGIGKQTSQISRSNIPMSHQGSRTSQLSHRMPVTRTSNLQLNKMDEGAFRNVSISGRQCSIASIRREPSSHGGVHGGVSSLNSVGTSWTVDAMGFSVQTKGQQRRESNAAITLDLTNAMNLQKNNSDLRKFSFEQNMSPHRSRRESINIIANSPRNSKFGNASSLNVLNELEKLERQQRIKEKIRKICPCISA